MYGTANPKGPKVDLTKPANFVGKKCLFVGGTSGIGQALARAAAEGGCQTTVVGRAFKDDGLKNLTFQKADLSSMKEAKKLADQLPAGSYDYITFTNGIVPGNARVATAEGVELDMAASALSRYVMLEAFGRRLKPTVRVFNWGFPGTAGLLKKTTLEDFNSEKSFKGGFEAPHMNTVALNEALVLHYAAQGREIYGMNPGLIRTGIRDSLHGGGFLGGLLETVVDLFNPSAAKYAATVLPLYTATELSQNKGAMFSQAGRPILPSPEFASSPALVAKWVAAADALSKQALASKE